MDRPDRVAGPFCRIGQVIDQGAAQARRWPAALGLLAAQAPAVAVAELGYVRPAAPKGELAPHWRRTGFATWLFQPAATGRHPRVSPHDSRPVPVLGEPWPGVPVRGRGAAARADACWLPVAAGLTPHGLRHTHKTLMQELGVPAVLQDERMGHADGSVQARYSHVTAAMRRELMADFTEVWHRALAARRELAPRSAVAVLDRLLVADAAEVEER